ncbi:carbohydrate ABC transporter permease [Kribbella sp.]|uniref:carbohydrate ABC transporter permease n=1 Tax=Kribbella sp. TaxID=1871183 RepID=UPI002D2F8A39|nr:carbohydrate ABC transporter permease [Kribbella sp.]HZX07515.1 carbohydrate ABC transporter permease [Kribbella sp.]
MKRSVVHIPLLAWATVVGLPLLWMALSALKVDKEIVDNPFSLPRRLHWDNFARAWSQASIGRYTINTLVVVSGALVLTMTLGAMAAYILGRFEFRGRKLVYYGFAASMTFPVFLALVPLFLVASNLHLVGTLYGLILIYAAYALPFTIFFLTPFFADLPHEYAEAARIDGAGEIGIFVRIMVPLARPGLVSVGIFNFLGLWNQYLLPIVLMPDEKQFVLSQGLAALAVNQGYQSDWSALFAGLTIAVVPVLAVYLFSHRTIQAGLTAGGLR